MNNDARVRPEAGCLPFVPPVDEADMIHRTVVLVLAVMLVVLHPLQAQERETPGSSIDKRYPPAETPRPAAKSPRRLQEDPYSLKHRPVPALNSPYSSRGRSMSIHRDERGRALGYSIRRPDGRTQYREFHGRGRQRSLGHAWQ